MDMTVDIGGMLLTYLENNLSYCHFVHQNLTRTGPRYNPCFRGEKTATNYLSHSKAWQARIASKMHLNLEVRRRNWPVYVRSDEDKVALKNFSPYIW